MELTWDTRIDLTPMGRYVASLPRYPLVVEQKPREPHPNETRTVCDCGAECTETYFGHRFCRDCVDYMEEARGPRCATCRDTRAVASMVGHMEIDVNCPDCTPDWE